MIMISGSSGKLRPKPPPILSTLTESGTRKQRINNKVSRLNNISRAKSSAKGSKFSHTKPIAMAVTLRPIKLAQIR